MARKPFAVEKEDAALEQKSQADPTIGENELTSTSAAEVEALPSVMKSEPTAVPLAQVSPPLSAVGLVAAYRAEQIRHARYEIMDGEVLLAKINGAEIARVKLEDKLGDNLAIIANNKHLLAPRLAQFAAFGDEDVFYKKPNGNSGVTIVSKDGRKYYVDFETQIVSA